MTDPQIKTSPLQQEYINKAYHLGHLAYQIHCLEEAALKVTEELKAINQKAAAEATPAPIEAVNVPEEAPQGVTNVETI